MSLWPILQPLGHLAPPSRTDQSRRTGERVRHPCTGTSQEGTRALPTSLSPGLLAGCPDQEHTRSHIQTRRATPGAAGLELTAEFHSCSTTFCLGS